jgi:hypothetical protein
MKTIKLFVLQGMPIAENKTCSWCGFAKFDGCFFVTKPLDSLIDGDSWKSKKVYKYLC